jgi:hypothetical protein
VLIDVTHRRHYGPQVDLMALLAGAIGVKLAQGLHPVQVAGELADFFSELQTFPGDEDHGALVESIWGSQRTGRRDRRPPHRRTGAVKSILKSEGRPRCPDRDRLGRHSFSLRLGRFQK